MNVKVARTLSEACELLAENPEAEVLAGGTDFMVEVNYRHRSPKAVVAINGVRELAEWRVEEGSSSEVGADGDSGDDGSRDSDASAGDAGGGDGKVHVGDGDAKADAGDTARYGTLWIGANLTYTEMANPDFARLLPALTQAARTVGSPQIRNAGTIGGNLGTASPAGDTLPVLAALDAKISLRSTEGSRELALSDFITGPKQTALRQREIIEGVRVPLAAMPVVGVAGDGDREEEGGDGRQGSSDSLHRNEAGNRSDDGSSGSNTNSSIGSGEFLKVGTRNAMVISVAGLALVARHDIQRVCVGLGSVAAVPVRPTEAEEWISPRLDWQQRSPLDPSDVETFGEMVAQAASPIDDHRSTAVYRSHAIGVMAKRALVRTFGSN